MSADFTVTSEVASEGGTMAAVDDGQYLIADVRRDDAWLSMSADRAPVLTENR